MICGEASERLPLPDMSGMFATTEFSHAIHFVTLHYKLPSLFEGYENVYIDAPVIMPRIEA